MLRVRSTSTDRLRCPWCQGEGAGDRWVTCERDNTPIHARCLLEFGICPICREPVDDTQATAATSRTTRRQIVIGREVASTRPFLRIEPPTPTVEVQPLPDAVSAWHASLSEEYRSTFSQAAVWGTWGACTFLGAGVLALASVWLAMIALVIAAIVASILSANAGRPRASALIPIGVESTLALQSLAAQIADGDLEALRVHGARSRAAETAREQRRKLDQLEAGRQDHHREALEAGTPIEDAQRIRGIGDGITSTLRAYGVATLADLRRRGTAEGIPQIGPKRASLLRTWTMDRTSAIDRLLRAGSFAGRAELDRQYDERLVPVRRAASSAATDANEVLAQIVTWVEARSELKARLDRALGSEVA